MIVCRADNCLELISSELAEEEVIEFQHDIKMFLHWRDSLECSIGIQEFWGKQEAGAASRAKLQERHRGLLRQQTEEEERTR